jgi:arsenite methyltransferase
MDLAMTDYLQRVNDLDASEIASVYDQLSFWSSRFGEFLFKHIDLRGNIDILDVGCGTGFPLFELAQVYGRSCRVTGIDIWREALDKARSKLQVYGLPNVAIVEADGSRMPFADARFDLIVSNLGLNNFTDPQAALAECFRVARPGSRLVLTTNVKGHMQEFYDVFRATLATAGKPEYLERLAANEGHRGTRESVCKLLERAGFRIARAIEDSFRMRYLDGSALLNHSLTRVGFLDGWRSVVEPDDEYRVFARLEEELNDLARRNGELSMTVPMLFVEGEKPRFSYEL